MCPPNVGLGDNQAFPNGIVEKWFRYPNVLVIVLLFNFHILRDERLSILEGPGTDRRDGPGGLKVYPILSICPWIFEDEDFRVHS